MNDKTATYGYCPACGAPGVAREHRPNGVDQCENGHRYPSRDAMLQGMTLDRAFEIAELASQMPAIAAMALRVMRAEIEGLRAPQDHAAERNDGIAIIAAERRRQVEAEGWTSEHDDEHSRGELAIAAASYAMTEFYRGDEAPGIWPWAFKWWKPTPNDRVRELAKAGALIAADIDRLLRAEAKAKS